VGRTTHKVGFFTLRSRFVVDDGAGTAQIKFLILMLIATATLRTVLYQKGCRNRGKWFSVIGLKVYELGLGGLLT